MATAAELKQKKNDYKNCLIYIKNTRDELYASLEKLDSLLEIQGSCYKVDDIDGGDNYLTYLKETENNIYRNIVDNIIPGIESKITSLSYDITDAEEAEALAKAGAK